MEDRVSIRQGDIKEAAGIFGAASFHVVTCNPPYMIGQHGLTNPHMPKAIARHEILCTLEDVVQGPFLYGAPALQAYGNYECADEVQAGTEANAAGLPIYRPGTEHGTD